MDKTAYENTRFKYQLQSRKQNGVSYVIWRLTPTQKDYVELRLGYSTEPYLYEIHTRTFSNIRNLNSILKNIHYSCKRGKSIIVMRLKPREKELLDEYMVKYTPYKYKIKLC